MFLRRGRPPKAEIANESTSLQDSEEIEVEQIEVEENIEDSNGDENDNDSVEDMIEIERRDNVNSISLCLKKYYANASKIYVAQ